MPSKYDSIWNELKNKNTIKLSVHPALQKRVIKGVIHCKDHDLIRKLEMAHKKKREKLTYVQDNAMVTITLTQYIDTKGIQLGEL